MGRELEFKYQASPEILEKIASRYRDFQVIQMETAYYDTPDGSLGKLLWTLRRRMENAVSVCTLKIPLPDGSRGEWEVHADSITAAIPRLTAAGGPEALSELTAGGVVTTCGARFTRLAKLLPAGSSLVELALDQGVLLGGGREAPLAELEVELKEGSDADAAAFARALAEAYGLTPQPLSKVQRAQAL